MKLTTIYKIHLMGVTVGLWLASVGHLYASSKSYYQGKRKLLPKFLSFYGQLWHI